MNSTVAPPIEKADISDRQDIARQFAEAPKDGFGRMVEDMPAAVMTLDLGDFAADRIGDPANIICGIASRANLPALNAMIEAAPAGEAGRGRRRRLGNKNACATDGEGNGRYRR